MSLVLCNKSSQNKRVNLEELFQDRLPSLGIREILTPRGWKKTLVRPHIKTCQRIVRVHHQEEAIVILPSGANAKLMALADPLRQEYFNHLTCCKTALLIFAQCRTLSDHLKKQIKHYRLPMAVSSLHENLLESRIKAIVQEKIRKCVTVHGVALEDQGKGILITGPSGIGKTSAALQAVPEGYLWIADDRVVIKKNKNDILFISGHRKIKKYLHTRETGIVTVDRILNASQIKTRAVLTAIIDMIRTDADHVSYWVIEKNILENRLPCLRIEIPRTGYFDKNMLKKAIQKLNKVG